MAISIGIGRKTLVAEEPTTNEIGLLKRHLPKIVATYSRYNEKGRTAISEIINEDLSTYVTALGLAKKMIEQAGGFGGGLAKDGFGIQEIRPDYIVPAAQGRTFHADVTGLTANEWYGLWHNGAIGAAYDATPLYLRKEVFLVISALMDVSTSGIIEEVQFEVDDDKKQVVVMGPQVKAGDLKIVRLPEPLIIPSSTTYRSQAKFTAASGDVEMIPVGIAFATSSFMKNPKPTQPSTTQP